MIAIGIVSRTMIPAFNQKETFFILVRGRFFTMIMKKDEKIKLSLKKSVAFFKFVIAN